MLDWEKTMVIAVHPDDETLGCGGTLLKLKAMGKQTSWLIVTNTNGNPHYSDEFINKRNEEVEEVKGRYGFESTYWLPFIAGELEEVKKIEIISAMNKAINEFKPDTLFLPFPWDIHKEHNVAFEAALACTKVFRNSFVKRVFLMETPSETDFTPSNVVNPFTPNVFVDISEYVDEKLDIMRIFESEVLPHPFPRSIESLRALSTVRGGQAGCKA
ncbi:MAG: PIG-L family deacetylase, partial [Chitinophagaceae bacterium]|nr:PIG-L family deacetylase [Chitinophagaceae bacterium]